MDLKEVTRLVANSLEEAASVSFPVVEIQSDGHIFVQDNTGNTFEIIIEQF